MLLVVRHGLKYTSIPFVQTWLPSKAWRRSTHQSRPFVLCANDDEGALLYNWYYVSSWDIRILKLPIQWNWSILLSFHLNTMYLNWKMAGGTLLHLTQTDGAFQTKTQCPKRTTERWYLYLVKKKIFFFIHDCWKTWYNLANCWQQYVWIDLRSESH